MVGVARLYHPHLLGQSFSDEPADFIEDDAVPPSDPARRRHSHQSFIEFISPSLHHGRRGQHERHQRQVDTNLSVSVPRRRFGNQFGCHCRVLVDSGVCSVCARSVENKLVRPRGRLPVAELMEEKMMDVAKVHFVRKWSRPSFAFNTTAIAAIRIFSPVSTLTCWT